MMPSARKRRKQDRHPVLPALRPLLPSRAPNLRPKHWAKHTPAGCILRLADGNERAAGEQSRMTGHEQQRQQLQWARHARGTMVPLLQARVTRARGRGPDGNAVLHPLLERAQANVKGPIPALLLCGASPPLTTLLLYAHTCRSSNPNSACSATPRVPQVQAAFADMHMNVDHQSQVDCFIGTAARRRGPRPPPLPSLHDTP